MSFPVDPTIPVVDPSVPTPPAGPNAVFTVTIAPYTPEGRSELWRFGLLSQEFEAGGDEYATQAEAQAAAEAFARKLHQGKSVVPDPRTITYTFDPTTQGPPA